MSTRLKLILFVLLVIVPSLLGAATADIAFQRAKTTDFCSSCHVMQPWHDDMHNSQSESLVSKHFTHQWIQQDQCYTCHGDYGFLGPIQAKIKGMRHVIAFYIGGYESIKLYEPFPNGNCLHCHRQAQSFLSEPTHDSMMDEIESGEESCIGCHDEVHNVPQDVERRAAEAKAKEEADAAADEKGDDGDDKGGDDAAKE